jgi:pyrophosphatase PpaX
MNRMQVSPAETLYVGDSPYDILCAHAANTTSAAVLWSNFPPETWDEVKPTFLLERLDQLLTLLKN